MNTILCSWCNRPAARDEHGELVLWREPSAPEGEGDPACLVHLAELADSRARWCDRCGSLNCPRLNGSGQDCEGRLMVDRSDDVFAQAEQWRVLGWRGVLAAGFFLGCIVGLVVLVSTVGTR